jgi:alkylation response protein AidB-like acyl-CoA dehydrogenase
MSAVRDHNEAALPAPAERALIDALAALKPMLADNAIAAEQQRKPVDAVMEAIEQTGAYRWFVPKTYGGYEFSLSGFMEVGLALGDGYRISGRWQWGTGVMHADWVMVGALSKVEGQKAPMMGMYLIPRDEIEVLDTWYIEGMVGTGSNDIEATDVWVPAHRVVDLSTVRDGTSPGAALHDSWIYRMPMLPVLGLTATAPLVGATTQAVNLFAERMQGRTVYGTTTKQAERALAQSRLAHAKAELSSIRNQLFALAAEVEGWGQRGQPCPDLERAKLRVDIGQLVRRSRNLTRDVVEACGASAHFLDNPLQRCLRDLNTASCHTVFDLDVSTENYGRLLVGLPPNGPV